MSAPNQPNQTKNQQPETTSVYWSERLKASIEKTDNPRPSAVREEDDLAALLRAQLEKSASSAYVAQVPDTSEFESADEEAHGAEPTVTDTLPTAEAATDEPSMAEVATDDPPMAEAATDEPPVAEVATDERPMAEVATDEPPMAEVATDEPPMAEVATDEPGIMQLTMTEPVSPSSAETPHAAFQATAPEAVQYEEEDGEQITIGDLPEEAAATESAPAEAAPTEAKAIETIAQEATADEAAPATAAAFEDDSAKATAGEAALSDSVPATDVAAESIPAEASDVTAAPVDSPSGSTASQEPAPADTAPASVASADTQDSDASAEPVTAPQAETFVLPEIRIRTEAHHLTDDRFSGLAANGIMGGRQLRELDEINARILEEQTDIPKQEEPVREAVIPPSDQSAARAESAGIAKEAPSEKEEKGSGHPVPLDHPLQMDLDDLLPPSRPVILGHRTGAPASVGYTGDMTPAGGEAEALSDTGLLMDLGYGENLRRADDEALAETVSVQNATQENPLPRNEKVRNKKRREYRGGAVETDSVESDYRSTRRGLVTRLCIAAGGALAGLLYDLLGVLPFLQGAALFPLPWIYPAIGLAWLCAIAAPFLPRMARGVKSLCEFEPSRYAVSGLAFMIVLINGAFACVTGSTHLFCGSSLLLLTFAALSELLCLEGEHEAFGVVSSGKPVHLLTDEPTPAASLYRLRHPDREEGSTADVLTAVRADLVADYFARTSRYNPYMGRLNYLLPVGLLFAVFCAGLTIVLGGDAMTDGIRVFTAAYLICLPAAYTVAMTLPLCRANRVLAKRGTAVLGDATPEDYAKDTPIHLIFSDGDAIKALYRKDVTLRGDSESEEHKHMAATVFRLLRTPLGADPVLLEREMDGYRVTIDELGEDLLRLHLTDTATGRSTEITAGSHPALTRRGIRLPHVSMEQEYKKSENSHVLYLAFDGSFKLAYAAEYRLGSSFARAAKHLAELGYGIAVSSYDPLLDGDMRDLTNLRKTTPVEVLRPAGCESPRTLRSGGVVATGRATDLVYPLAACRRMKQSYRSAHKLTWLGVILAATLSIAAVAMGFDRLLGPSAVFLWQSLGVLLAVIHGVRTVNRAGICPEESQLQKPEGKSGEGKPHGSARKSDAEAEKKAARKKAEKAAKIAQKKAAKEAAQKARKQASDRPAPKKEKKASKGSKKDLKPSDKKRPEAKRQKVTPVPTPAKAPTQAPVKAPTQAPVKAPTQAPAKAPVQTPAKAPTQAPAKAPDNKHE